MLGFGLSIEPQAWAILFIMIRVGAAFITAPVFGAVSIPLPVRISLAGAIAFLVNMAHPVVPPPVIFAPKTTRALPRSSHTRTHFSDVSEPKPHAPYDSCD